jgi:hypothetical protein
MDTNPPRRNAFVLRIWRDTREGRGAAKEWTGWIQHVRSGESIYVQNMADIIEFIEKRTGKLENNHFPSPQLK